MFGQEKMHDNQSNFIKQRQTSSAKKIQDRYICDDESVWSDPDISNKPDPNQVQTQIGNQLFNDSEVKHEIQSTKQVQQQKNKQEHIDKQYEKQQTINRLKTLTIQRKQQASINNSTFQQGLNQYSFLSKHEQQAVEEDDDNFIFNSKIKNQACNDDCQLQSSQKVIGKFDNMRVKIAYFLKNFTRTKRTQNLNSIIRYRLNDLSDIIQIDSSIFFPFCYKIQRLLKQIDLPLMDPQTKIGFLLKIAFVFFNLIYFYLLSLFLVFQIQGSLISLSKQFISTIWVIEIVLYTNQKVYTFSEELQSRKEITLFYLKKKAIYDFIPLVIIFICFYQPISELFQILQFLKVRNLILEIFEIQLQLCMKVKKYYLVQLTNLILKLFLLAHVISSLWYLLGQIELKYLEQEQTWYDDSIGSDGTWWKLYLAAMYWTLTLMATGSNESRTVLQAFFTTFTMLFTNIAFAYILSVIGIILSEMDQGEEHKRKDVSIINEYMRKRHISNSLKARVNLDLEHYYKKNYKQEEIQNMQVLEKVSVDLQESLILEYNKKILNKIQFLNNTFSTEILEQASLLLKEQYFFPNQVIKLERDQHDFFLIYVLEGKIESHFNGSKESKSQNVIQKFKKGDTTGQYSFFTGIQNNQYLKSTEFTKLMILSRKNFMEIIKKNEKEFQKFNEIKDKLLFYNQFQIINLQCDICQQSSHFTIYCPNICMKKQQIYSQIQYLENQIQDRDEFQRKTLFRGNSLFYKQQIKQIAQDFIKQIMQNDYVVEDSNLNQLSSQEEIQTTLNEVIEENYSLNLNQQIYEEQFNFLNETSSKLKSIIYTNNNPHQKNESRIHQKFNSDFNEDEQYFQAEAKSSQKYDFQTFEKIEKQQTDYSSEMKSPLDKFQRNPSIEKDMISSKQKKETSDDNYISKNEQCQSQIEETDRSQKIIKKKIKKIMNTSKNSLKLLESNGSSQVEFQNQQTLQKFNTLYREFIDLITQKQKISFRTFTNINQKTNNSLRDLQFEIYNPFLLDSLKDYQYYFSDGNSKMVIPKFQKAQLRKAKALKKQMKSFKANTNQTFSY